MQNIKKEPPVITTYLFDWGDTLMVDFPNSVGKMCNWGHVETVPGAYEALAALSKEAQLYIATGASDSSEQEIKAAFQRADISQFITGYFCKENLGITKDSPDFFKTIITQLGISPSQVVMVGDSYEKDIKPALAVGITSIWLSADTSPPSGINVIRSLHELCARK